jgi:hypothetical protein
MPGVVNVSIVTRTEITDHPLLRDPCFRRFFEISGQTQEREGQVVTDEAQGTRGSDRRVSVGPQS